MALPKNAWIWLFLYYFYFSQVTSMIGKTVKQLQKIDPEEPHMYSSIPNEMEVQKNLSLITLNLSRDMTNAFNWWNFYITGVLFIWGKNMFYLIGARFFSKKINNETTSYFSRAYRNILSFVFVYNRFFSSQIILTVLI